MFETIINLLILFVASCAMLIFMVVFGFFLFIMFACVYIGWEHIKGMPISAIWEKIKKEQ
jgi:hypothetical protein